MALIPYEHTPEPHDPPLSVAGQLAKEFYCGDFRCDCATGHLLVSGVALTIDLGTTRVDFLDEQTSPSRVALQKTVREWLQKGAIETMRAHYAAVREYGREQHFRYVNWSNLKQGDLVSWEQVFRTESTPMWKMGSAPPAGENATAEGEKPPAEGEEAKPQVQFLLGLNDAYCIEPRCDCQKVTCTVTTAPPSDPRSQHTLGTIELPFATKLPSVQRHAANVDPNQLFMLVHNLLRAQPQIIQMFQQRYNFARLQLTTLMQAQRRQSSQPKPASAAAGRNDPCPCGSGKKYKKCHGAK